MNYLGLRIRMNIMQRKLNKYFDSGNDFLPDSVIENLEKNPANKRVLEILNQNGCIHIMYASGQIYAISRGSNSHIYLMERSELWLNRIVSFIAGVLSTLLVQWIIRVFL